MYQKNTMTDDLCTSLYRHYRQMTLDMIQGLVLLMYFNDDNGFTSLTKALSLADL